MTELHLTDEQLAALADESMPESNRPLLVGHIRSCDECHAAFIDAVRYRAILLADPAVFRAPDDMLRLARSIARPGGEERGYRRRPWWLSQGALVGFAAAALVAVAAFLWQSGIRPGADPYGRWIPPLQQAAASASAEGSIVLPGAEQAEPETSPLYRTGFVPADETIAAALAQLTRAYREDARPDIAQWLISGYLATGELEQARVFAQDARLRFSDDTRFFVLDAIVAYRSNEMQRAERLLQTALAADPHDGAALLNLALVQYETGQFESARRTLELVRTEFRGSPLEARAATLISDLLNG
jgi:Tfp pilus assembly protein PilF